MAIVDMGIKEAIHKYMNGKEDSRGRIPQGRYSSFDYCYNYFYSFYKENRVGQLRSDENLQRSCLELGFYLASWGMFRGSTFLLQKSVKYFENLIAAISNMKPKLWEIDVDNYDENIELLLKCKKQIDIGLGQENNPTDTLITKIMLGVFANIPAFDTNFRKSFGLYRVDKKSLFKIKRFYEKNSSVFNSINISTLDFLTGKETHIKYTKAKLIDMYGFINGQD